MHLVGHPCCMLKGVPFFPALVLAGVGMVGSAADGNSQLAILRVARVLIENAAPADTEVGAVPEWVRKLIIAQACVHDRMGGIGDEGLISQAERILQACLKSRPYVLDVYLDVLTAEDRSSESLMALSAASFFAVGLPSYEGKLSNVCALSSLQTLKLTADR